MVSAKKLPSLIKSEKRPHQFLFTPATVHTPTIYIGIKKPFVRKMKAVLDDHANEYTATSAKFWNAQICHIRTTGTTIFQRFPICTGLQSNKNKVKAIWKAQSKDLRLQINWIVRKVLFNSDYSQSRTFVIAFAAEPAPPAP